MSRPPDDESTPSGTAHAADGVPSEAVEFVAALPAAGLVCDPASGVIRAANDAAATLFDQKPGALPLLGIDGLGAEPPTPDEGDGLAERAVNAGEGERVSAEWTVESGDGERRQLEGHGRIATLGGEEFLVVTADDVTDRVRAKRALRNHRRVIDAVAGTMPAALIQLDAGGTLSRWNRRFAEDTGYESSALAGRSLIDLFEPSEGGSVGSDLARVYRERDRVAVETTLLTREGKRLPYRLTLGPVTDANGEVVGAVGIGEDRTEWSLREQRLSVLTRVLRHNFRNDLNVIMGFGEQALNHTDDETVAASLRRVVNTAEGLLRVGETSRRVERLLDEPQAAGTLLLSDAVEDALAAVDDDLLASADVTVSVPDGVTVEVVDRFPEAVKELIDNAIRHNDAERPRVHIHAAELPNESWVTLSVADDGDGIPPAERAVLTGTERELDHASGLGLWYVNWVVTAAGGSLSLAESKAGGARVDLSLRRPTDEGSANDGVDGTDTPR